MMLPPENTSRLPNNIDHGSIAVCLAFTSGSRARQRLATGKAVIPPLKPRVPPAPVTNRPGQASVTARRAPGDGQSAATAEN